MLNSTDYYRSIRVKADALKERYPEGFLYVTSLLNPARNSTQGCVTEVNLQTAARMIIDGVARPSTPEEVEAFKRAGEANAQRTNAVTQRNARSSVILISETDK